MKKAGATFLAIVMGVLALAVASPQGAPVEAATTYRAVLRKAIDQLPVRGETPGGFAPKKFPKWSDADGDGQDTRAEVLIQESKRSVTFTDAGQTTVATGTWRSPFEVRTRHRASAVAVDQMVPLKEAWDSGARSWTLRTRRRFANDLGDRRSLLAFTLVLDRARGARDAADWLPRRNRCGYIKQYVAAKVRWRLAVDRAEKQALHRVRRNTGCRGVIQVQRAKIGRRWTHFGTRPVGAELPSGATCAGRVRPAREIRPGNKPFNSTMGTSPNDLYPRVRGNFTGTTDQILQWAACKWGIDEDLVRAQAVIESWWYQDSGGDTTTDKSRCHPAVRDQDPCPESVGLLKVRYPYHVEAFEDANAIRSSAYNVDYAYAVWRQCYDGKLGWLNNVERGRQYRAGDAWGCIGVWFSGRWYTDAAVGYMDRVRGYLDERTWRQPYFINAG